MKRGARSSPSSSSAAAAARPSAPIIMGARNQTRRSTRPSRSKLAASPPPPSTSTLVRPRPPSARRPSAISMPPFAGAARTTSTPWAARASQCRSVASRAVNPDRRAISEPRQPACQVGVVRDGGSGADQDGIMAGAHAVSDRARDGSGDPLAGAGAGGDAAVERARELECDQRAAVTDAANETGVDLVCLGGAGALGNLDTGPLQALRASAVDPWVGVADRDDGARDAGIGESVGTRRRPPVMRARLKGNVGDGAAGGRAGPAERLGLGVGPPARLGPPSPDDAVVFGQYAAHRRVGPSAAERPAGEPKGRPHMARVTLSRRRHSAYPGSPRSRRLRGSFGKPRRNVRMPPGRGWQGRP